jgi:acyl carrier protein
VADLEAGVLAEIRRILANELEVTRTAEPDDDLAGDLEVDSLGAVVLAVGLEDRFRIRLSDVDAAAVVTVGDLVRVVCRRVRESGAGSGRPPCPDEVAP